MKHGFPGNCQWAVSSNVPTIYWHITVQLMIKEHVSTVRFNHLGWVHRAETLFQIWRFGSVQPWKDHEQKVYFMLNMFLCLSILLLHLYVLMFCQKKEHNLIFSRFQKAAMVLSVCHSLPTSRKTWFELWHECSLLLWCQQRCGRYYMIQNSI